MPTWSHFVSETLLLAVDLGMDAVAAYALDPASGRLQPAAAPISNCRPDSGRVIWLSCRTVWWPSSAN